VLTDDEKIRFLEAMEEEDKISHRDLSSPKKQLNRKLSMLRRLGATDWYNREDDESPLSLRDITLPQSWGDQMAALRNAPPHQKSALIELFNRRFDTNYPTDFKLPPEVSDDFSQKYKQFIKENPSIPELGDLFD